jgi:two-component system sensor histidine kinase/response regulator
VIPALVLPTGDHYTTKGTNNEKGSGLGLLLCREFVEMHNGKIWAENNENKGTTFYFTIPLTK